MKTSVGEYNTQLVLEKLKIPYKREVKLENLVSAKKTKLPADFLIRINDKVGMIEFNGRQHYHATSDWRKSLEEMGSAFNNRQKNDQRRRNYVYNAGIPLLEIHFKDFDNIESIITHYIKHIKNDCSQPETQYGEHSKGYFAPTTKRKTSAYKNAWLLFFDDEKPKEIQKTIRLEDVDFSMNETDKKLGFILLEDGKIIWTKEKLEEHIIEPKILRNQMEKQKKENRKLQSSYDKLRDNHLKETKMLQMDIEKLKEENKKLQTSHDKAENSYREKLEEENLRLKASNEKRKHSHVKKTNALESQLDKLKEENKKLKATNSKLKNKHVKATSMLEAQVKKLEEENKKLEPNNLYQRIRQRLVSAHNKI